MIYEPWDVVIVPFPFSDSMQSKLRKALVLSQPEFQQESSTLILAMITSAQSSVWPGDVPILDLHAGGLRKNCVARLKLFTLDEELVSQRAGHLSPQDQSRIRAAWQNLLVL